MDAPTNILYTLTILSLRYATYKYANNFKGLDARQPTIDQTHSFSTLSVLLPPTRIISTNSNFERRNTTLRQGWFQGGGERMRTIDGIDKGQKWCTGREEKIMWAALFFLLGVDEIAMILDTEKTTEKDQPTWWDMVRTYFLWVSPTTNRLICNLSYIVLFVFSTDSSLSKLLFVVSSAHGSRQKGDKQSQIYWCWFHPLSWCPIEIQDDLIKTFWRGTHLRLQVQKYCLKSDPYNNLVNPNRRCNSQANLFEIKPNGGSISLF